MLAFGFVGQPALTTSPTPNSAVSFPAAGGDASFSSPEWYAGCHQLSATFAHWADCRMRSVLSSTCRIRDWTGLVSAPRMDGILAMLLWINVCWSLRQPFQCPFPLQEAMLFEERDATLPKTRHPNFEAGFQPRPWRHARESSPGSGRPRYFYRFCWFAALVRLSRPPTRLGTSPCGCQIVSLNPVLGFPDAISPWVCLCLTALGGSRDGMSCRQIDWAIQSCRAAGLWPELAVWTPSMHGSHSMPSVVGGDGDCASLLVYHGCHTEELIRIFPI